MYPILENHFPDAVDLTALPFALPPSPDEDPIGGSAYLCRQDTAGSSQYIKLSKYNEEEHCFTGHEAVTEVIVSRYLDVLGIPHLDYQPLFARVFIDGRSHHTLACVSKNFCEADEEQICLSTEYTAHRNQYESVLDFCKRQGWGEQVYRMILTDYLVLNRDRSPGNLILLKNRVSGTLRPAPLFDHGLCLLSETRSDEEASDVHVLWDAISCNYIGSYRVSQNLNLIPIESFPETTPPAEKDRARIFQGLEECLSPVYMDKVWEMLTERYREMVRLKSAREKPVFKRRQLSTKTGVC